MDVKHVDLHLLMIFDAVLSEGNVTRAADRIDISQSAVSKGLAQLREIFRDPLFLRNGRGVVPTHKAMEMATSVRQAILALHALASPSAPFAPHSARLHFNIAATDYVSFMLLPPLMQRLASVAPSVSVAIHPIEPLMPEELLLLGRVDLVLSPVPTAMYPVYRQELFRDDYVCLHRIGHPLDGRSIDAQHFASHRHVAMPRQNGARERVLQDAMQQHGVSRDVAAQVPHMLSIPPTLVCTDLIATITRRVATSFCGLYPLRMAPHPLPLGEFVVSQLWHERTNASPSQQWLRALLLEIGQAL
ncbi:Nodulation protein D 2 [Pigmentiphaga humi]|uniref:Nodulation protein D 2 n=1 Tax=Pigmentiphaga humi TaxID=2478468 RepID=A0A3P4B4V7_9BURK|nr:LysR family transcriptional regulator [Pigmentiphaga humi]VCU70195.1 Nodulation protein D 2 [Pigmentiphaga humi]